MARDTEPQSNAMDVRRKRLLYRSWHRGTKEMDLLLGRFADRRLATMNVSEIEAYEVLLAENDPDLYNWISGREAVPADRENDVLSLIIDFYKAQASG